MVGSKAKNSTSSEYGHVAYQIKRNHTCSNIIGNILPAEIKWTHKCSNMVASVLPAEPPPDPVGGLKIPQY